MKNNSIIQAVLRLDVTSGRILIKAGKIVLGLSAVTAVIACLLYQFLVIPYPYSMDYGEAPLVDQAMRLVEGQNIYRPDLSSPPYTISNYPPLYVAVLAISVRLLGPAATFTAGRIISALSAWIAAICLAWIVTNATRDRLAGLISGAAFIAFPFVTFWSPLLRIDMFAVALSLTGLCLLSEQSVSRSRFLIGGLLLTAAIFTRQSFALAAPFAAFVWILSHDWRRAIRLALLIGGGSLAIFLVINMITQGGFFYNIITANVNEFGLDRLKYHTHEFLNAAFIPVVIGLFSLFLTRRWNPLWLLAAPYLIGASISAMTIGKIGSNVNYFLELCAAISLAIGVVTAWSRAHLKLNFLQAVFLFALSIGMGQMTITMLRNYTQTLQERITSVNALKQLETLVAETPGQILADEFMGMLTLQGRPLMIQPFEVTQLAWSGMWDQTPLIKSITNKEFSAVIIYDQPWAKERWTQEMFDAVKSSYVLTGIIAGNKIYSATSDPAAADSPSACPGSTWRLPSDTTKSVKWRNGSLDFFGQGQPGNIPVYAVADGLLMRLPGWFDAVAIQHDDPLHPGNKIWSYYGDMAAANGVDSYVSADFPPGSTNIPVKAGQILGYQGSWSGKPLWSTWSHVNFALVDAVSPESFPDRPLPEDMLDPTAYFKIDIRPQSTENFQQKLKCGQP